MIRSSSIAIAASIVILSLSWPTSRAVTAQSAVAVAGTVSSPEEGNMEGVLVTVRRASANFTVSVVSDAQGRYSFPRSHVAPGSYTVTVRAVGYDIADGSGVDVPPSKTASLNIRLRKTSDLGSQLTSLDWLNSMPGTTEQKNKLAYQIVSCAYCHTFQRIMKSRHTAEAFVPAMNRMQSYYADGTAVSDDGRGRGQRNTPAAVASAEKNPDWGFTPGVPKTELGQYLATVNLSDGRTTWPFELKGLPRPHGAGTRIIVTEWDMPRKDTVSHDMDIDSKGIVWYTDEARQFIGKLDPRTNTFTEYAMPAVPAGDLVGTRDIQVDREDKLWFPLRAAGGKIVLARFDPATEALNTIEGAGGQFMALGPDGKIWAGYTRVNPKTMTVEASYRWNDSPNLPPGPHGAYVDHIAVNSKGNLYISDFRGSYIIGIDTTTPEAKFWPTPTRNAMPRRGRVDAQDRYWFGEYTGDRVGMFDSRTEKMQEWPVRAYAQPYTSTTPDPKGYVYSPSNMSERLMRLNPATGEVVEYLMPGNFDVKKIAYDPTTTRVVMWMANTRNARMLRVEPLD